MNLEIIGTLVVTTYKKEKKYEKRDYEQACRGGKKGTRRGI